MLIVHRLSPGAHRYYLSAVGDEGGATPRHGESPGQWLGRGAQQRELVGDVHAADLRAVLPSGPRRVPGFDLTFAAPKSVSVLHGLADAQTSAEVRRAHDTGVCAGLDYLEHHACVVRADGAAVAARGFVVAAFRHRVSRADDPHLHTHALAANAALGPDGRWLALHAPLLYAERRGAAAVYHAVLRRELSGALGVTWTPPAAGRADIEQVPVEVRTAFSQRRAAVLAEAGDDVSRRRWAERVTRPERAEQIDFDELVDRWRGVAATLGWRAPTLVPRPLSDLAPVGADALPSCDKWTRSDVLVEIANQWRDGGSADAMLRACDRLLASSGVVSLGRGASPRNAAETFTTEAARGRRAAVDAALAAQPAIDAQPSALDRLRRELEAQGRTLVLVAPDRVAAGALEQRTGAPALPAATADASLAGLATESSVVAIVRQDRMESAALEAIVQIAAQRGASVVSARPEAPSPVDLGVEGAVVTVPVPGGDLTAAATAGVAAGTAVSDWVRARLEGRTAVLQAAPMQVNAVNAAARDALRCRGLLGQDEVAGFAAGDRVRFVAPRPTLGLARHDVATVAEVDQRTDRVRLRLPAGTTAELRAQDMRSVVHAHAVPPVSVLLAGSTELFVVGGTVPQRVSGVVHRYVTVAAPVGLPGPAWSRRATLGELEQAARRRDGAGSASLAGERRRHDDRVRSARSWGDDADARYRSARTPVARAAWAAQLAAARAEVQRLAAAEPHLVERENAERARHIPREAEALTALTALRRAALEIAGPLGGPTERTVGLGPRHRDLDLAISF